MGIDYRTVITPPPTQDELREQMAAQLRRQYATPRGLAPIAKTVTGDAMGAVPIVTPRHVPSNASPMRDAALARYDELVGRGWGMRQAREQVMSEMGTKDRTLRDWLHRRAHPPTPKPAQPTGRLPASGRRINKASIMARLDALAEEYPGASLTKLCKLCEAETGVPYKTTQGWLRDRARKMEE